MGEAKRRQGHCAFCGEPATSRDHVPPQSLFTGDRTNLITVPSCEAHNGRRSGLDERFREFVALFIGRKTQTTEALWDTMARGVRRSQKRRQELAGRSRFLTDLGMYAIEADMPAFNESVEQITRGLYWHCYHERLPLSIAIQCQQMEFGNWIVEFTSDMARAVVGVDQFFYAYKRMDEYPTISVWVYLFHRRLVGVSLTDVALADKVGADASSPDADSEPKSA